MGDSGFTRFPLTLDPTAQEFRPTYSYTPTGALPLVPPYIYYSYPYNHPTPPPPPVAAYIIPDPPPTLPPPSTTPTRTLLLSSVPTDVSESTVRRELEVFGDVRAVQMERLRDGLVTVHFYDLRQATEALNQIQEQHMQQQCRLRKHFDALMLSSTTNPLPPYLQTNSPNDPSLPLPPPARGLISGRAIWAQFTFPVPAGLLDGYNQGTIVISNLDSDVSAARLREIFEAFGRVKELRGSPLKNQRFVEFYDTRDAAKAVAAMNGSEIDGKEVVVEFSRSGGHKCGYKSSYKQTQFSPIILTRKSSAGAFSYGPPPPSSYKFRRDRAVDYGGGGVRDGDNVDSFRGGSKKNVKSLYKQQPSEQEGRWAGGGGSAGRSKPWKGSRYTREKHDQRFLIKEDEVISSFRDSRTTLMIKNIPNKYSQKLLLNMLDNHCIHCNEQVVDGSDGDGDGDGDANRQLSSYDFVYLPIDFMNKCNVGYGFVNMTSPEAAWRLYKAFHHQNWEVFNSKKICEVSYARLQGLEALKDHFKNSRFPCEAEEYMPVVFTPPRDGRVLTEPMPIVGHSILLHSGVTSSSSEAGHDLTDVGRGGSCDNNLPVEDVKSDDTTITTTAGSGCGGNGNGNGDD